MLKKKSIRGKGIADTQGKGIGKAAGATGRQETEDLGMGHEQLALTLEARGDANLKACAELAEPARSRMEAWLLELAWRGYGKVRVIEARRSLARQMELFGKGRTARQLRKCGVPEEYADPEAYQVTWCQPEEGKHVLGLALDVDISAYKGHDVAAIRDCARRLGITCGADWKVRDQNHYEVGESERC